MLYCTDLFIDFRYRVLIAFYGPSFTVIEYSAVAGDQCAETDRRGGPQRIDGTVEERR